jgi:2-succinyl-6-hydroxy-2,4-cyclohexadiene-1-carboxylate synthase
MPRLALLHGFTQTGRSWAPLLPALEDRIGDHGDVLTPDLPGHGTRSDVRADLWEAARLVGDECGRAAYVGYSMGGRVALHLGLERPDLVERLVLVSATGGIESAGERAARRRDDETLAQSLENEGVDAFLARWLATPLFADLSPEAAGLDARRENTAAGLAAALRLMGTGTQEPLLRRLDELTMPVLVVAGEHDEKFAEQALHLGGWIGPTAQLALVPDAGHACHLESSSAFLDLVVPFLEDDHGHGH